MKRVLTILIGIGMLTLVVFAGTTQARSVEAGDTVTVTKNQTVDSTLYAAGSTVTIDGTVKGDVFCAASTVTITGTVEGDVICAGKQVSVSGKVYGDVRLAGQSVNFDGAVQNSATLFGQSVVTGKDSVVGYDLTVGGSNVALAGQVGRDVVGGASDMNVSGTIGRTAQVETETLTLQNGAKVGGDLVYTSKQKATVSGNASVAGTTTQKQPEATSVRQERESNGMATGAFGWFLTLFVVGLVLWLLMPKWFNGTAQTMTRRPWVALGLGLATLVLTPIASIVLFFTVFGIPLGIALLLLWLFALLGSFVFAAYGTGSWAMNKLGKSGRGFEVLGLVVGIVVLTIVGLIPFVGGLGVFLALLWGLGGITMSAFGSLKAQQARTPAKKKA